MIPKIVCPELSGRNLDDGCRINLRNRQADDAEVVGLLCEGSAEVPHPVENMHVVANGEAVLHARIVAGAASANVNAINGAGRRERRLQPDVPTVG